MFIAVTMYEVFVPVKIHVVVFWIMTPCSLMDGYQCFGGIYYNHFQVADLPDTVSQFRGSQYELITVNAQI
jgi:hypothetical protein